LAAFTATPTGLPLLVAGGQQADAEGESTPPLKVGTSASVWKCSQAMPCGSVIQCLSLRA
jgi:hypothetical protein